ncbi:MAG: outer membrane beta-barrel protein [Synechococcales bacterium]|nr:outer membrane beta-barrel protein [Synechococcales bacterium]
MAVALTPTIQGFLLEDQNQGVSRSLSSIVWEQDGMIYTAAFPPQEYQNLLQAARSMADSVPIAASARSPAAIGETEMPATPAIAQASQFQEISQPAEPTYVFPSVEPIQPAALPTPLTANSNTNSQEIELFAPTSLQAQAVQPQDAQVEDGPGNLIVPPPPPDPSEQEFTPGVDDQLQLPEGLRPLPQAQASRPESDVQLLLRSSILTNSDIAAASPVEDTAFVNGATLLATPELGSRTDLVARASGSFVRFANSDGYNLLGLELGVRQRLGRRTFGDLGWRYRQIYGLGSNGDSSENAAQLVISRFDELNSRLSLNSSYELRASFNQDADRNRISNRLSLGLQYDLTSNLQGLLNYRFIYDDFTRRDRLDSRHQLSAGLIYRFNRNVFLGGSVSYLFGESLDLLDDNNSRDFDGVSVGINFGLNLPLFE